MSVSETLHCGSTISRHFLSQTVFSPFLHVRNDGVSHSAAPKAAVFSIIIIQVFMVHSCSNTKPQLHIHMLPKKGQFPVANSIPQILQMLRI